MFTMATLDNPATIIYSAKALIYVVYSDTEYVFFQANSNSYATLLIKDRGNVNITVAENAAQIITSLSWPAIVFAFVI